MELLDKLQALIEVEKELTATLEKVEPWLHPSIGNIEGDGVGGASLHPHRPRVRPIPTTMDDAELVLSVARTWASRTSAPVGWNPAAPVVGFSTPSPLPHQLRGGALAALQLERARQAERQERKKRQRQQQQQAEESEKAAAAAAAAASASKGEKDEKDGGERGPKRRQMTKEEAEEHARRMQRQKQQQQRLAKPKEEVSMNLSDSSSDDED